MTDLQPNPTPYPSRYELDPLHEQAVEAACERDRGYAERHPEAHSYLRPALADESCGPFGPCVSPAGIRVWFLASSVRAREATGWGR